MDIESMKDRAKTREAKTSLGFIEGLAGILWEHQQHLKKHPEEAGDWQFLVDLNAQKPGSE